MEKEKKRQWNLNPSETKNDPHFCISPAKVLVLHLICGLGLASAFWAAQNFYSLNLLSNPAETLYLIWIVEASVVILLYSLFRHNPDKCSYFKAVGRALLGLPAGAIVNALGAIVLGAPVGLQNGSDLSYPIAKITPSMISRHLRKTLHWSLLMSVLTFVPAASVFGSSWTDWHRIFAQTKPIGAVDYMICLPAHGAAIGAWFGAWPMPLDWERPWQEWPICVTYGAIFGYLAGMMTSFGFTVFKNWRRHVKRD